MERAAAAPLKGAMDGHRGHRGHGAASKEGRRPTCATRTTAAILAFLMCLPASAMGDCFSHINVTDGPVLGGISSMILTDDVRETASVGTEMYVLSWDDEGAAPTLPTEGGFIEYFSFERVGSTRLAVRVGASLRNVPDYPNVTESLTAKVEFSPFDDINECIMFITHNVLDENTQIPILDKENYNVDIREDYPVGLQLPDLKVDVADNDGTAPNNQFSMAVEGCPLKTTEERYGDDGGNPVSVHFELTSPFDFEAEQSHICTVTATDFGSPPLSSSSAFITISLIDMPDEPPKFSYDFYFAEVTVSTPSDVPLETLPGPIQAEDGDTTIQSKISFSMVDARQDVLGTNYFSIDSESGAVTVTTELDTSILEYERISFLITAQDESGEESTVVLEVSLPPAPTTTASTTTVSTTEVTCEVCTCPSEEPTTEGTDETTTTGPTTTTTEAPVTTCPTPTCPPITCSTTTGGPISQPSIAFTKDSYAGEIYATFLYVWQVKVVVQDGVNKDDVRFSWEEESENFALDEVTGDITVRRDGIGPGQYPLVAIATVPGTELRAEAQVQIVVLEPSQDLTMTRSLLRETLQEANDEEEVVATIGTSGPTGTICITGVTPQTADGKFKMVLDGQEWKLKKTSALNYEDTEEVQFKLSAFEDEAPCSETSSTGDTELLRNEALVIISVEDVNDEEPYFVVPRDSSTVVAYPEDAALQKVVGPVITVQVRDEDTVGDVTYAIDDGAERFTVEEDTGSVYVKGDFACIPSCDFNVTASDGRFDTEATIKVLPLKAESIFTLRLEGYEASQVDGLLADLSQRAGVRLAKVYATPGAAAAGPAAAAPAGPPLQVHLYGVDAEDRLMSLGALNEVLSDVDTNLKAEEFTDKDLFHAEGGGGASDKGLKVAVGVLGALLGVALIAGVVAIVYWKKGQSKSGKDKASPISSLGRAYPNLSYKEENEGSDDLAGTLGRKINGTGIPGHNHRESPPLYRSAFSPNAESPLSDTRNDQQRPGGPRRTDPIIGEYYSTSSDPTPPYEEPLHPQPIYAKVVKPARMPSSPSAPPEPPEIRPPKSIFRGPPPSAESMPLAVFPGTSSEDKPDEPDADYEVPKSSSKFLALKGSPPPRKSSELGPRDEDEGSDDDDDDDGGSAISYPGGKKSNLKEGEGRDEDEKKSVAFKVLVDTKEIEAENEGPAQKKAAANSGAIDILAANKKRLEEAAFDDDEDDEEDDGKTVRL